MSKRDILKTMSINDMVKSIDESEREGERKMKIKDVLETSNKCCNEYDLWADCDKEGHSEGCFATYCDNCGTINYRDCEVSSV